MTDPEVVAVAAVSENGVIGDGNELPWHVPEESSQYRRRVADEVVALGRRTFEMMADDPAGDRRIVLSRSRRSYDDPDAYPADGVEEALSVARDLGADPLYVLGGEAIYRLFLPHCDRLLLSRIHGEYEGTAHFPAFDREEWTIVEETPYERYTIEEWHRRGDPDRPGE
jgi:dihydrofolate reductase